MEATFCIVDLAGFSALTEAHGDTAAADMAERFAALVRDTLGGRGRLVKTIGDAVLVTTPSPSDAVEFTSRLFACATAEPDFPVLRAGLHEGEAVERGGDVFGAAVNLTARVAARAGGSQVLATRHVAMVARERGIAVTDLGVHALRNVRDPVEIFELTLCNKQTPYAIDPVCRMRVHPAKANGRLRHEGGEYWFCSLACARLFAESPHSYVRLSD